MSKWKTYVVKAGKHYSRKFWVRPLWNPKQMSFQFKVNHTWNWPEVLPTGWSKIQGFSRGRHHKNSARLGVKVTDGDILVGLYAYVDGHRVTRRLCQVYPGRTYTCTLKHVNGWWVASVLTDVGVYEAHCVASSGCRFGYQLYPYVGGEYTLDNKWVVDVRRYNG